MSRIDPIREAAAVKSLRESLAAVDADDEQLLADTIEGETGLFECIDRLLVSMADDRVMIAGIDTVTKDLSERQRRFEKRVADHRAVIEQAMMIAELNKIERPVATLFLARRAPKVEVGDEADIPSKFWTEGAPKLNTKALIAALQEGETVPGATLTNSAPSLSIRSK